MRRGGPGLAPLEAVLTGGFSLDFVPGIHGGVCAEPAVEFLAHHLARRVKAALGTEALSG